MMMLGEAQSTSIPTNNAVDDDVIFPIADAPPQEGTNSMEGAASDAEHSFDTESPSSSVDEPVDYPVTAAAIREELANIKLQRAEIKEELKELKRAAKWLRGHLRRVEEEEARGS